jgi:hypothetical protein
VVELLPNALSFRVVSSIDVNAMSEVPERFTGRVRLHVEGTLLSVSWLSSGVLHDPARLVAAEVRYRPDGKVKWERHYQRGLLHDPVPGHPAVRGFHANGGRNYEEHYQQGVRHDGPHGTPAITKWRTDGTVRRKLHYERGAFLGNEPISRHARPWVEVASVGASPSRSPRPAQ